MNINNFGNKLKINLNNKSEEKEMFISIVSTLEQCWLRTNIIHTQLGVDFYNYEQHYFTMIEDLLYLKYGETVSTLVLWYVYDRYDQDGDLLAIDVKIGDKPKKQYLLKTPLDLWILVEKILKTNK
jgi:hypothetical protein